MVSQLTKTAAYFYIPAATQILSMNLTIKVIVMGPARGASSPQGHVRDSNAGL